jgi:molybdopterin synthase sulfur carrier subunit
MKVNFYATLRPIIGQKTVELDTKGEMTAQQLIDKLVAEHPAIGPELIDENGKFYDHMKFFINGREVVYMEGQFEYVLQPDDKVDIFPPVGGG